MSPKTTNHASASLIASAHARGLVGCLLLISVAILCVASATASSVPLYSFNGSDGTGPQAGLVQGSDGDFYGTTVQGGASGAGTIFKITSGGSLTTLHSFRGSDGALPFSGLVQGSEGNFYGTTLGGGTDFRGTVFKITEDACPDDPGKMEPRVCGCGVPDTAARCRTNRWTRGFDSLFLNQLC